MEYTSAPLKTFRGYFYVTVLAGNILILEPVTKLDVKYRWPQQNVNPLTYGLIHNTMTLEHLKIYEVGRFAALLVKRPSKVPVHGATLLDPSNE